MDMKIDSLLLLRKSIWLYVDYNFARAMPQEKTIQFGRFIKKPFQSFNSERVVSVIFSRGFS